MVANSRILKTFLLTIIHLLAFASTAEAQELQLKLEKVRNGKVKRTKIFKEDDFLVVRTYDGHRYRGIFAVNNNQSIVFEGGRVVQLSEIAKIRKRNGRLFGGVTLVVIGTATSLLGTWAMAFEDIFSEDNNSNSETATLAGVGTLVGGIFMLSSYNYQPKNGKWQLQNWFKYAQSCLFDHCISAF